MADITQKLSIDVSGAVQALDQLDKKLASFGTSLDGLADKFSSFNASAKNAFKIGDAVKPTEDAAQRAKRAFDALFETQTKAAKGGQAVAAGANKAATGLTKVRTAATGAQSALQRIGAIGGNAFKGIFGSLANLTRIIGTRVLIQGFGALQRAISGSIQSASELSQKIREVGTILPTTEANAKNLTEQVRKLSDTFNLPINAVTEGLYQTISNQIGDVSESLAFLGTASKFAKVAVTDIDTAVSLLSGTLNAFGLAARDTEAIADKLFKTIELGRTRASELANSLGRVLPVAKELGVSLDEVLAGFATVTIAGIKTSEATTQLRGAFNSILKPTEAMKDLLAELGFESGEAFIQAKGLQGAFATIREAAGGSIQALSKFIPRVRGMNAALILGASGAERFQENLKKIRDEASGIIEAKFEFVVEAEAEQLANTVNRIKNLFTVELGNSIISTLAKMTSFIGGLDNVSAAMKTLVPVATALAISIAAIGTALFVGNAAYGAAVALAAGLTISLGALAAVAALVLAPLAALIALDFAENKRIASINAEIAAIKERNEQELAFEKKQNAAVLAIRSARLRELNSVIQEEIAAFNKGFKQRVSDAKAANDEIIADQKRVVEAIVSAGEASVKATQKRIAGEKALQKDSNDVAIEASQELSDFQFKAANKRFNELQKFSNVRARANAQLREAAQLVKTAASKDATKEDVERARAAFDRAQSTAEEAQSIANSLGNRVASSQIEKTIESILRRKVAAENAITTASKQREAIQEKSLARQREELDNIKELAKAVLDAPSLFDEDTGKALTGDKQREAIRARDEALRDFRKGLAASKELSVEQLIDFSQLSASVEKQLVAADIQSLSVNSAAFQEVRRQINDNLKDFRAEFGGLINSVEFAQDVTIVNPGQLSTALSQQVQLDEQVLQQDVTLSEETNDLARGIDEVTASLTALEREGNSMLNALRLGLGLWAEGLKGQAGKTQEFAESFGAIQRALIPIAESFREQGTLTDGQIDRVAELTAAFGRLGEAPGGGGGFTQATENLLTTLNKAALKVREINELQSQAITEGGTGDQVERNQAVFQEAERAAGAEADKRRQSLEASRGLETAVKGVAQATDQAATATQTQVGAANQVASAWERAASAAERTANAAAQTGGASATAAIGRFFPKFLSGGGFSPRGTDTIPAMLSPGEFVVNARSSRRFFSQLQAMNAGVQPVYRQEGGPVTTVGDINVTVSGGQDGDTTGRTIARRISRELRRGNASL